MHMRAPRQPGITPASRLDGPGLPAKEPAVWLPARRPSRASWTGVRPASRPSCRHHPWAQPRPALTAPRRGRSDGPPQVGRADQSPEAHLWPRLLHSPRARGGRYWPRIGFRVSGEVGPYRCLGPIVAWGCGDADALFGGGPTCSPDLGWARSWPPPCCVPGPTLAAAAATPRLRCSAAPRRSRPPQARPSGSGATAPGTASSTRPWVRWSAEQVAPEIATSGGDLAEFVQEVHGGQVGCP
jgi:hypothetical protein